MFLYIFIGIERTLYNLEHVYGCERYENHAYGLDHDDLDHDRYKHDYDDLGCAYHDYDYGYDDLDCDDWL